MKTVVSHFGSLLVALLALMVKLVLIQKLIKFKINFESFLNNKYHPNYIIRRKSEIKNEQSSLKIPFQTFCHLSCVSLQLGIRGLFLFKTL